MSRPLSVVALLLGSLVICGCNSSRTFGRKDYAESRDPFMGGVSPTPSERSAATGVASLSAAADTLRGPKPIQQAAGTADNEVAGSGVAQAVYPVPGEESGTAATRSWQGPALSGFLAGRDVEPAVATAGGGSVLNRTAPQISASPLTRRASPAAEAASMKEMNEEIGGFGSFLDQTAASGSAAVQSTQQAARDTAAAAGQSARSFSDFTSQKKAEWAAQGRAAKTGAAGVAAGVREDLRNTSDDFFEQLASPAAAPASTAANGSRVRTNAASEIPSGSEDPAVETSVSEEPVQPDAMENPLDDDEAFFSPESAEPSVDPFSDTLDQSFSGEPRQ